MKNNKHKVLIAITAVVFSILMILVFSDCKSFSIDDYNHRIQWHEQLNYEDIKLGDGEIDNKWEALKMAKSFLDQRYDIGLCIYTVSYDSESNCWLVEGESIGTWLRLAVGGAKGLIIHSDGTVIAFLIGV